MESIRIENWRVVVRDKDFYKAPECGVNCLSGDVYGHPRHEDGTCVTTTKIVDSDGKFVKTRSGSLYELGVMDADYCDWLEENGLEFDPECPIKVYHR